MVSIYEQVHNARLTLIEAAIRQRMAGDIARHRLEVVRDASRLRQQLANQRQREAIAVLSTSQTGGKARRLENLTYPIEQARQLAQAKYNAEKEAIKARLVTLLKSGQKYTLRELGALLGKAPATIRTYKLELEAA